MASFNLAQYNLAPFNASSGKEIWLDLSLSETVHSIIGYALDIYANAIYDERIMCEVIGHPTRFVEGIAEEEISGQAAGNPVLYLTPELEEVIEAETDVEAIITPSTVISETINGYIVSGARLYRNADIAENVNGQWILGCRYWAAAEGFEVVTESASVDVIDLKTCILNLAIQPGDTLVIDSESYTVLKNGENAIESQQGDWIDELNRSTTDISVKASTGAAGLTVRMVYTEKYL